jgi:hypothetical protein
VLFQGDMTQLKDLSPGAQPELEFGNPHIAINVD